MGNRIIISTVNRETGKSDHGGDLYRVLYMGENGLRYTHFCDSMPDLLHFVEDLISTRRSKPSQTV